MTSIIAIKYKNQVYAGSDTQTSGVRNSNQDVIVEFCNSTKKQDIIGCGLLLAAGDTTLSVAIRYYLLSHGNTFPYFADAIECESLKELVKSNIEKAVEAYELEVSPMIGNYGVVGTNCFLIFMSKNRRIAIAIHGLKIERLEVDDISEHEVATMMCIEGDYSRYDHYFDRRKFALDFEERYRFKKHVNISAREFIRRYLQHCSAISEGTGSCFRIEEHKEIEINLIGSMLQYVINEIRRLQRNRQPFSLISNKEKLMQSSIKMTNRLRLAPVKGRY